MYLKKNEDITSQIVAQQYWPKGLLGRAGPGQTMLLQSLCNNSINTFDMSQLDHKGTLFFTPKLKAFSCSAVSVVAEEVT